MWRVLGGRVGTAHGAGSGIQHVGINALGEGVEGDTGEPNPEVAWWETCRLVVRTAGMWIAFQDGRDLAILSITDWGGYLVWGWGLRGRSFVAAYGDFY